jgi:hypothetical protein
MYFGIFEGICIKHMLLSFPKFKIIIAYFKLIINTQKPQYLQSLQCHINIGVQDRDESAMAYPRGHTYDVRGLFAGGASTQCLSNWTTIIGRSSNNGSLKT